MLSPALSTMWMQLRHASLPAFVAAARAMGFEAVELSHIVTAEQIESVAPSDRAMVRVLHHPCPADGSLPELSDADEERRQRAVAGVGRTLCWAKVLGAQAVVCHVGEVALDRRWENALRARWLQGDDVRELYDTIFAMRNTTALPHIEAIHKSLSILLPVAADLGIALGIETGEWLFSMPSLDEATELLDEFGPPLGLWVDTGHATIQERLGGPTLEQWLRLAPERVVGLHYHDVNGLRDHLIPGRGTIDWEALAPLIPSHALPTCELDWYYNPDEIVAGVNRLVRAGLVAPLRA